MMAFFKKVRFVALCGTLLWIFGFPSKHQEEKIEDFSDTPEGKFPDGWWARDSQGKAYYRVRKEENGNLYLRASVYQKSIQIIKRRKWDPNDYPMLSWRWRMKKLPIEGNEQDTQKNDSAGGVYVGRVKSMVHYTSLKYIWSTTLPVGTRFQRGNTAYIVLRSGQEQLGQWVEERVDVRKDYEQFFGEAPKDFSGIGLLTDADNTQSSAEAHYDDFRLLPPDMIPSKQDTP